MPSRRLPFGSDTLEIPVYFAKGSGHDDPSFQSWKREHPDCFAAGHWTSAAEPRQSKPPTSDGRSSTGRLADLTTFGAGRPDPSTLSVSDFQRVVAEAKAEAARRDLSRETSSDFSYRAPLAKASQAAPKSESTRSGNVPARSATGARGSSGDAFRPLKGQPVPGSKSPTGYVMSDAAGDYGPPSPVTPPSDAQFVLDNNGSAITVARTNDNLIAPLDWSPQRAIEFGHQLKKSYDGLLRMTGDDSAAALSEDVKLAMAYRSGAQFDLQMNYNGNEGKGPFNIQFTDAAAYSFGITAAAAGYSLDQAVAGAVCTTLLKSPFTGVDTSGYWWNDPDRVVLIRQGYRDYIQGRLGR